MTDFSSIDQMVQELKPSPELEATWRREYARQTGQQPVQPTPEQIESAEREARASERQEQAEVYKILRAHGFEVYNLSQARESKQTPGLADCWWVDTRTNRAGWFEVKRPEGGVQSRHQRAFQAQCERCGITYIIGGRKEAWQLVKNREPQ